MLKGKSCRATLGSIIFVSIAGFFPGAASAEVVIQPQYVEFYYYQDIDSGEEMIQRASATFELYLCARTYIDAEKYEGEYPVVFLGNVHGDTEYEWEGAVDGAYPDEYEADITASSRAEAASKFEDKVEFLQSELLYDVTSWGSTSEDDLVWPNRNMPDTVRLTVQNYTYEISLLNTDGPGQFELDAPACE